MTERQACERIVMDGSCVAVSCSDCPLWGEWECFDMDEVTLAEMWLRLHPYDEKLVFSAEKFYADESILECLRDTARALGWPDEADGKTGEECIAVGIIVHPNWMEERTEMKVFSREKYLRVMDDLAPNMAERRREYVWPFQCEGKTEEECDALGYGINPEWMEER